MPFSNIKETIKKHIYIIFSEKFVNNANNTFIERFVAKHPALRPEFIVVNDKIHGFKKMSKKVASLEKFPIYLEIEGILDKEKECYIDSIELYAEASINCQNRLTDIIYLAKCYEQYVVFERVIDVANTKQESIIITSNIHEFLLTLMQKNALELGDISSTELFEEDDDDDLEDLEALDEDELEPDLFIEVSLFTKYLGKHLTYFVHFIKLLDDILVKKRSLKDIEDKSDLYPEFEEEDT